MTKELISVDPSTGIHTWFEFEGGAEGKFNIHHTQDVEPIIEHNKRLQNEPDYKKAGIKNEFQHFATIPDIVIMQWMKEGIDVFNKDHWPAVLRKLRDPQYRHLRTSLGGIR